MTLDAFPGIQENAVRLIARLREDLASLDEIISALSYQSNLRKLTPGRPKLCRTPRLMRSTR